MPPTLLTVGSSDVLLDDSLFLYARLIAAGVAADLEVYPGGVHGFDLGPTAIAKQARNRIVEWLDLVAKSNS